MINLIELLIKLKELGYDNTSQDNWWWPNSGTFEIVVGAILTQNTKWENVQKSLNNLKQNNSLSLEALSNIDVEILKQHIKPSGFHNQKSRYLKELSINIIKDYKSFEEFKESVSREWLLNQKGIGQESADAILNYACYKEAFVVDAYTNRLLKAFDYEFESYNELQDWMVENLYTNYTQLYPMLNRANAYARIHGMIVEYVKANSKGRVVDVGELKIY